LKTIKASSDETAIQIEGDKSSNDAVFDAGAIRAMVDPAYRAELRAAYRAILGPPESIVVTGKKSSS